MQTAKLAVWRFKIATLEEVRSRSSVVANGSIGSRVSFQTEAVTIEQVVHEGPP
jgi:hypothetical protein